jgi:hypothetical protein
MDSYDPKKKLKEYYTKLLQIYTEYWYNRGSNFRQALKAEFTGKKSWSLFRSRGTGRQRVYVTLFEDLENLDTMRINLGRHITLADFVKSGVQPATCDKFGFDPLILLPKPDTDNDTGRNWTENKNILGKKYWSKEDAQVVVYSEEEPPWVQKTGNDGIVYWYNKNTKDVSLNFPSAAAVLPAFSPPASASAAPASASAASASASGGPLSRPPGRSLPPAPGVGAPAPTSVVAASAASAPAPALSDDDDSDDAPVVPSQFAQDIAAAAARRKGAGVSAAPAAAAPALVSRKAAAPALFATKAANPWYEDSSDDDSSDDEDEDKRRRIFREKVMEKMENVSSAASAPSASAASASAASTSAASIPASLLQMPSVVGVKNPLLLTEEVKPSQLKCPGVNSWFFETELPEGIMCKNCYKMKKYHIPFTSGGTKSSRRCRRRHRSRRRSHHRSNKKSRKVHRVRKVRKSHRHVRS